REGNPGLSRNATIIDPLRGLARWTEIRRPPLKDGAADEAPAPRAGPPLAIVDPQEVRVLPRRAVGGDEVRQRRPAVLERGPQDLPDRLGEPARARARQPARARRRAEPRPP